MEPWLPLNEKSDLVSLLPDADCYKFYLEIGDRRYRLTTGKDRNGYWRELVGYVVVSSELFR